MKPLKIFLLLLLVVTAVICTNDRYNNNKGVFFYDGQDWDDGGDLGGWEEDDYDDYGYDDNKYDKSWDDDDDEDCDDDKKKYHKEKTDYFFTYQLPRPTSTKPLISTTTLPPHHYGNYNDGYNNGFTAGLVDPNNRNHTIEYLRTATDCGINKRIDVIDGVSYIFSTATTVGPEGVTRTEVVLDGTTILLPYTGAEKMMSTIPLAGVTRTVVKVEDEATTLPLHIRPTPPPQPPSPPSPPQMLEELPEDDEERMAMMRVALDAMPYGKALAVGDDGISGTVLRHIKFDQDGNPIIPSIAGTRPVYVINDITTTLFNGIPPLFPVDNGHTRTVVALRSGVLTLPLTGGDEITKLLPIDGLTETVVVFEENTYTLEPDNNTSSDHTPRSVPSRIVHTVIVEEILSKYPPTQPAPTPARDNRQVMSTAAATMVAADEIQQLLRPSPATMDPRALFKIPPKTIVHQPHHPTESSVIPEATTLPSSLSSSSPSTLASESSLSTFTSSSSSFFSSIATSFSSLATALATIASPPPPPPRSPCPTKWVLKDAQASEGCYMLSSVTAMDSAMHDVDKQGHWTTDQCHHFCANSTQIQQLPSYASWYYGLTVSATDSEVDGSSVSSTCRCLADLSGAARALDQQACRPEHGLGLVYPDNETSTIYIYQATYRCLLPSLKKRADTEIAPPDTWRCPRNAWQVNKRHAEGCYPYLSPKVTIRKERSNADGTGWYWTAARCYSFCLASGRVPSRGTWYYGMTLSDPGSALMQNSCLCMLDMGAPPNATECQVLSSGEEGTSVGRIDTTDRDAAAIYAYQVDYTCLDSCNTTTTTFKISDTKAAEGCYAMSNYADRVLKKTSRSITTHGGGGVYTPEECFQFCNASGVIVPGQSWWYGISMTDPADTRKGAAAMSTCRCSIKAPTMSRYDILAGRCNQDDVGLVDSRFLYRINNGVYVYKVSYQCPPL